MKKTNILKSILLYSLPIILVFGIVLIAHWPGILVSDALVQWHQTQTGDYTNWHPIFNTLYIKALSLVWNTPGIVIIVQIFLIALSVSYFLTRFEKYYNVNKIFLFIISCIFAIFPLNFNFAITLLKDIIYSVFILFLASFSLDMVNNKEWLKKWYNLTLLILDMFAIAVTRHNGIIVVGLMLVTLFIFFKQNRKCIVIAGVSWIVIYFVSTLLVNNIFNVTKATYANTYGPISHVFARMLNTGGVEFSEEELNELSKYVDVEKLKETYNQYNMDYSINSQKIEVLKTNGSEYLKFAIGQFLEYPTVVIKHYIKLTSYLYSPIPFKNHFYVGMFIETDLWEYKDEYPELAQKSRLPKIYELCQNLEKSIQTGTLGDILMRPALWMYLSIISVVIIMIKTKNKMNGIVILPTIFNTLSLVIAIPVAMVRYVYPTLMFAYLIIPIAIYMLFKKNKIMLEEKNKEE